MLEDLRADALRRGIERYRMAMTSLAKELS